MSLLKRIASLFSGGSGADNRILPIYVLSLRCNEPIAGQIDLFNELSQSEDESEYAYYTRKVLHTSGEKRCFDQVEVNLWFDRNKNLVHHEVERGRWLEEEGYEIELARFQSPPDEDQEPA